MVNEVAAEIVAEYGACQVTTSLGEYQESKHLQFHLSYGEPLVDER